MPLLEELAVHDDNPIIRVLLIARARGEWWDKGGVLRQSPRIRSLLAEVDEPTELDPPGHTAQDNFWAALERFAALLGIAPPTKISLDGCKPNTPVLMVHAAALLAVLDAIDGFWRDDVAPDEQMVAEFLGHEAKYWATTADAAGLDVASPGLDMTTLARTVALVGLLGMSDMHEADVLRRLPALASAPALTIERIVSWLYSLYPVSGSQALGLLQPDLILEYLVTKELTNLLLPGHILNGLSKEQAAHALDVLVRALDHYPEHAALLLRYLLAAHIEILAWPATQRAGDTGQVTLGYIAADVISTSDMSSEALADLAAHLGSEPADSAIPVFLAVHQRIGGEAANLSNMSTLTDEAELIFSSGSRLAAAHKFEIAASAFRASSELFRMVDPAEVRRSSSALALNLTCLGDALCALGRADEAIPVLTEAAELYREVCTADVSRRPRQASALTYLGTALAVLGRCPQALPALTEAVELYREAHASDPSRYRAELALALISLGYTLNELGSSEDARVFTEAVELYREAHASDPSRYRAELALALTYLADIRRDVLDFLGPEMGVRQERMNTPTAATVMLTEAARLCQEAVAAGLRPERSRLALALANLERSRVYWSLKIEGRNIGFSIQGEEAAGSRRQAFVPDPDQDTVDLARTMDRLARSLFLHASNDATPIISQAVELYRRLHNKNPHRYRMPLARSLWVLGIILRYNSARVRRHDQRMKPAHIEAARLCVEIATADPDEDRSSLLPMLDTLGQGLNEIGCHREAVLIETERVRQWRQRFELEPGKSRLGLASGLTSLAGALRAQSRDADALPIQIEAVDLYRELSTSDGRYRADFARGLSGVGDLQAAAGHLNEALNAHTAAIAIYKVLVARQQDDQRLKSLKSFLATALSRLAVTLDLLGRHEEAASARQDADQYGHTS